MRLKNRCHNPKLKNKIRRGGGAFGIEITGFGMCYDFRDMIFGITKSIKDEVDDRMNEHGIYTRINIEYSLPVTMLITIQEHDESDLRSSTYLLYFDVDLDKKCFEIWYNHHRKNNGDKYQSFDMYNENVFEEIVQAITEDLTGE